MYSTRPTNLHALKENIREEIPKFLEETLQAVMRSFLTRVHLCIEDGGGHLKDIVYKEWNYRKKKLMTIVNCDVLKLISITFSKTLFLFIISSLFLRHPVFMYFKFAAWIFSDIMIPWRTSTATVYTGDIMAVLPLHITARGGSYAVRSGSFKGFIPGLWAL